MAYFCTRVGVLMAFVLFLSTGCYADIDLSPSEKREVFDGELVLRSFDTGEKYDTYEAIGLVQAPVEAVLKVLSDYDQYCEFMPNVKSVTVVEKEAHAVVLDYVLQLPLRIKKQYRLLFDTVERDSVITLSWEMIQNEEILPQETIKETKGCWILEQQEQNTTLASKLK